MSGMYRSQAMAYARLLMTGESAHETIKAIGNFGKFHFVDLGSKEGAQSEQFMYYKKRVAACYFWEKKLEAFRQQMELNNVIAPGLDIQPHDIKGDVIVGVKTYVEAVEQELDQHLDYKKQFETLINEQKERRHVLETCRQELPFHQREMEHKGDFKGQYGSYDKKSGDVELKGSGGGEITRPLIKEEGDDDQKVNSINGVIPVAKQAMFERMLFRVTRGNVVSMFHEIQEPVIDPVEGKETKKSVFQLIFFGNKFQRRITKICQFFGATIYQIPSEQKEFTDTLEEVKKQIGEYESVLKKTRDELTLLLSGIAFEPNSLVSPLVNWVHAVKIERMICDVLKKCDTTRQKMVTAEGWIPEDQKAALAACLKEAAASQSEQAILEFPKDFPTSPPTYFETDKYTDIFQGIVNTYGVPRYQEVNPGLFTIATFPFLYGVMYGDIGHSTIQLFFALYLIWHEDYYVKKQKNKQMDEIFSMLFSGRYLILGMACFALYCGFIYNDCFSCPLHLFSSRWTYKGNNDYAYFDNTGVYPFGVDPSWYHTNNELTFFNSLKMKMAVTLGVIQMVFGICLGLANDLYWHDNLAILFEFIPRLLFMLCTFGYMIFIIIYKMTVDWTLVTSVQPPNLIQTMISMFLSPGIVTSDNLLYNGQAGVQLCFLIIALLCVPLMLFPGPLIARYQHQKAQAHTYNPVRSEDEEDKEHDEEKGHDDESGGHGKVHKPEKEKAAAGGGGHGHGGGGEYSFSDHMITQGIHTIEFVLGAVSNTASYLRLWALSLAHSQLAAVFWDKMMMQYGIDTGSPIMIFIGFAVWVGATFGVLLCMDSLECFLHALRLHWVEFQNKFYHADGYAFAPFSFLNMDAEGEE